MGVVEGFISWLINLWDARRNEVQRKRILELFEEKKYLNERFDAQVRLLARQENELGAANSNLTERYKELEQASKRKVQMESVIQDLREQLEHARRRAESSEALVQHLEKSLEIERERFDRAIDIERDIDLNIRKRAGLVAPQAGEQVQQTTQQAVHTRATPWKKEAAKREADSRAEYWTKRIKEVEAKDAGNSGTTADGADTPKANQG